MTKPAKPESAARNLRSHSGTKIHAGKWQWIGARRSWFEVPACGFRRNTIAFGYPTDDAVTCDKAACSDAAVDHMMAR